MINAGKYNKRISIVTSKETEDDDGFSNKEEIVILKPFASVKTTKGFTLITSNSDFEKAYTNFTIRYPKTEITRDMLIKYNDKIYTIEYLNNIDEESVELEIQAKEVTK
ncbi:MAG: phage head closure protein [Clostridia bacterium]|nr:phage head closure protein [Clostridia bacterium]